MYKANKEVLENWVYKTNEKYVRKLNYDNLYRVQMRFIICNVNIPMRVKNNYSINTKINVRLT